MECAGLWTEGRTTRNYQCPMTISKKGHLDGKVGRADVLPVGIKNAAGRPDKNVDLGHNSRGLGRATALPLGRGHRWGKNSHRSATVGGLEDDR